MSHVHQYVQMHLKCHQIFSSLNLRAYIILFSVDTNDKIINDVEIQTFGQELTKSKSDRGCGIPVSHYLTFALCGLQLHLF